MRKKIYEWLWWKVGWHLWINSAGYQPLTEVKRRLGWMQLDCIENTKWK